MDRIGSRSTASHPSAVAEDPGPKSRLEEALAEAYEDARDEASAGTNLPLSLFPARRPFDYVKIMERSIILPGDEE